MKKNVLFSAMIAAGALVSCGGSEISEPQLTTVTEAIEESHDHDGHDHNADDAMAATEVMLGDVKYMAYGMNREFSTDGAITMDAMVATVTEAGTGEGVVAGTCSEICQMAGCWIEVATEAGDPVFVKFKDHYTLPIGTTVGRNVMFHGTAKMDTTSVELQKHYLEDRQKAGEEVAQEEFDAITEPKIEMIFVADGILVEEPSSTEDVVEEPVDPGTH